ncbi:hypothetical protein C4573_00355 [Candidatus Woesearchaeota archaeon]|nr:MAG: hypothetical protein C4573_00355 [Candidatus Woesearchaeota archaeon]
MNGIELAIRFSFITNSLQFCGPHCASDQFMEYVDKKNNEKDVEDSLKKFEGLYPYLSTIAEKTGKKFTDYEVIEAYWIGNKLLEQFDKEDLKKIIEKLMQRGLPKSMGEKLIKNMPSGFMPHHNFNVFYVGVGNTTGSVPTNLQNMDNCRISWGKVSEVLTEKVLVQTPVLKKQGNQYYLGKEETKTIVFKPSLFPSIKKGDVIALHWGFACLVLTEEQLSNLKKYTRKIIDVMNKIG